MCKVQNQRKMYSSDVYSKFLLEENPHGDFRIEKDLYRTLPGNKDFMQTSKSGKNKLFNVLKAYQAYDPATGYCQGMNFVVALLL